MGSRVQPSNVLSWPGAFVLLSVLSLVAFTIIPGNVEGKSLAILHGLCAQQPTHSYYFEDARLPFDARMTGIYGGFAFTALFLAVRGRWKRAAVPTLGITLLLLGLVAPLAVDGVNSLLKDVELPYLYEPRNFLRTVTGLMLGTMLASFAWLLVAQTAFRPSAASNEPIWKSTWEPVLVVGLQVVAAATLAASQLPVRVPLTYVLIVSAATVVTALLLPFVMLVTRTEQSALRTRDLARPATFALVGALVFIGAMAGGRFLLELTLGVTTQPPA